MLVFWNAVDGTWHEGAPAYREKGALCMYIMNYEVKAVLLRAEGTE